MRTALTERFGIEHPVMSAGMARVSQAPLVAAVSAAGGMGCLGGVSYLADALRDEIRSIRSLTTAPFAVNLLVPPSLLDDSVEDWEPVRAAMEPPHRRGARQVARRRADADSGCGDASGGGRARRAPGGGRAHVRCACVVRHRMPRAGDRGVVSGRLGVAGRAGAGRRRRLRRRPGHRGRGPHRLHQHDRARSGGRRCRADPGAGGRRDRRWPRAGGGALPRCTWCVDGHPVRGQRRGLRTRRVQAADRRRRQQAHDAVAGLHRQAAAHVPQPVDRRLGGPQRRGRVVSRAVRRRRCAGRERLPGR